MSITEQLSDEFGVRKEYMSNIVALIDADNTIPFIARYRKEMTGSCDDQVLRAIYDRIRYLRNLEKRRQEILSSIEEQGKLTEEIASSLEAACVLSELEDIYRPFKQKKKTRASVAKEKGLAPLAELLFAMNIKSGTLCELAASFVNEEKGVLSAEEALAGASDIIAETVSDNPECRKAIKTLAKAKAFLTSSSKTDEDSVYSMYYEFSEPVSKIPSHRILAINRGENEGILRVSVDIPGDEALNTVYSLFIKENSISAQFCRDAAKDGYLRLIFPSVEREIRNELTQKAQEQAIKMFGQNLAPLLMQPPVRDKVVLAVDPAYRTGCKISVLDRNGKVLEVGVIYPTPPQSKTAEAAAKVKLLIEKYGVDCISIGNGTASKETEIFIADTIKTVSRRVSYMVVNEAGASVYSASPLGAKEFPEYDVSLRSAVSIGRRLQDPLSELVKIDPRSIGVGQYQHDVPQTMLSESLAGVVESCVNAVGVDLNTASAPLLGYISGISSSTAQNIVKYRENNDAFGSREELKKVKGLGPKAFTQCAGFLRVPGSKNVFDNTGVHPESYAAAEKLLRLFGYTKDDVLSGSLSELRKKLEAYGAVKAAGECRIGLATLNDITDDLMKPGRDIRDDLPKPVLRADIMDMSDLKEGSVLTGTVRNVIDFGAFVDIGVHQDGLVHISQICSRYIRHPSEVLKVGDVIKVRVLSVDAAKKRISLSMRDIDN